jgi:hypothetical protein
MTLVMMKFISANEAKLFGEVTLDRELPYEPIPLEEKQAVKAPIIQGVICKHCGQEFNSKKAVGHHLSALQLQEQRKEWSASRNRVAEALQTIAAVQQAPPKDRA